MSAAQATFQQIVSHVRETRLLGSINALLEWDQQTQMPAAGASYRAEQVTYLAGKIHERATDDRLGDWLNELAGSDLASDPHSDTGATIRELSYRFRKKKKLPLDLVKRQAALHSTGQQIWVEARKQNDFQMFAKTLEEIFQLKREEAQATCETGCLYDALLDDYEPGAVTRDVTDALSQLRDALIPLITRAVEHGNSDAASLLRRSYPVTQQKSFVEEATRAIGFDYERGRLDIAPHPFCTETGPNDCRITTRYDESMFSSAFFGCLHEAGHGMYEQGLREDQYGLPPGMYCSLGIHESQSRLWENLVGRSRGFWKHFFDVARDHFPDALGDCNADSFFQAVNVITPSLIRVEADEATYNMHIIIRFELEQALIDGRLTVDELPEAWNTRYRQYLGIEPPDDSNGVLQDIHWSAGLVGYFPTYTLGNIYASMLYHQAESDLGLLEPKFESGDFQPLLDWLRENIHRRGNCLRASELMQRVTGSSIDHAPLVQHLTQKVELLCSTT